MGDLRTATEELYRCFYLFNEHLFKNELPEPIILIQSRGRKNKNVLGWISKDKIWENLDDDKKRHEITIVAENLDRDYIDIMRTLLHEMVHLYNIVNDIKDVTKAGKHNNKFKEASEKFGFYYDEPADPKLGWSFSKLTLETVELIKSWNINEEAFKICRVEKEKEKKPTKKKTTYKLECPSCGIKIKSDDEGVQVICKECEVTFIEIEK